ncbi:hypothetical protein E2C00_31155 [Streptomyces sp. WAC05374]|uniref:hypothetical protein n=1 Tax=Streptomyces sp. WAC05374 TaxID=2487420 RepID=UPI000F86D977|nr:hypothetical protein [Streptomyces sp. WAC05374]RST15769.1 hypothetical protein EF905_14240 [Streptomyces sp. WAC05374]TDF39081.1 hypothetical protein E2B92_26560 [Streptomyces sp. WAC05374]TDF47496.1 hypothetical protein E2C02_30600 [Streptomyces sp. WAC05374]TDF48189.1 hypothetical protein E2C00_31155 [Streptomyces sp. WAC05374]
MTDHRRRLLGRGPDTAARPAGPSSPHGRPRLMAAQADLDTAPLRDLNLPDLDELRHRGVLDAHALTH